MADAENRMLVEPAELRFHYLPVELPPVALHRLRPVRLEPIAPVSLSPIQRVVLH